MTGTSLKPSYKICFRICLNPRLYFFGKANSTPTQFFRRAAEILGAEFKILGAQLQILVTPTPKGYLTLQKNQLGLLVVIWAYSSSIETTKTNKRIRIFHTRVKLR